MPAEKRSAGEFNPGNPQRYLPFSGQDRGRRISRAGARRDHDLGSLPLPEMSPRLDMLLAHGGAGRVSTNGRTPPHDENAERVLIGLALSLGRIPQAATRLVVADFYQPVHAVIWSAMHALAGLGRPCDVTALRAYLQERGMLNASTGVSDALLIELIGQPTPVDADYVVDIILERAKRRSLIEVFERGLQHAYESSDDVDT